jgi:hypothetical protein
MAVQNSQPQLSSGNMFPFQAELTEEYFVVFKLEALETGHYFYAIDRVLRFGLHFTLSLFYSFSIIIGYVLFINETIP